jgi:hypothetical protein
MPPGVYARRPKPVEERIKARIRITDLGCWEWLGSIMPNGYGVIGIGRRSRGDKRTVYVHRLSFQAFIGPIPDGKELDHLCRRRCCCNPAHLEPVTRAENTKRGLGPAKLGQINASKTQCAQGHPFTPANTRLRPTGGRSCRQCARDASARKRAA